MMKAMWIVAGAIGIAMSAQAQSPCALHEDQKILTTNPFAEADDLFGLSVAMDGIRLVIGAPNADRQFPAHVNDTGVVSIFTFDGTAWGNEEFLEPADIGGGDDFGQDVDIDGDIAIGGAPNESNPGAPVSGAAFVFTFDGSTWGAAEALRFRRHPRR